MCSVGEIFFCKQKTAYEMRISDWSSDVCSSDLGPDRHGVQREPEPAGHRRHRRGRQLMTTATAPHQAFGTPSVDRKGNVVVKWITTTDQIGRASCRERVCQYV